MLMQFLFGVFFRMVIMLSMLQLRVWMVDLIGLLPHVDVALKSFLSLGCTIVRSVKSVW